jgi:hypothetical protein
MKATAMWILMGLNGIEWDVYIYLYILYICTHTCLMFNGNVSFLYHADLSWKVVGSSPDGRAVHLDHWTQVVDLFITRPGKLSHNELENHIKSPFSLGKSTISMAIFNSYVKLLGGLIWIDFHRNRTTTPPQPHEAWAHL